MKYILFLETYFCKIPKNLIVSAFFLPRQILKNVDMPRQKPTQISNAALVKLIESLKMIMWLTCVAFL